MSKTKSSFYRRLYIAYLIESGVNTVPAIVRATGMPRRTAQETILALSELGIRCEFVGPKKTGKYKILNWGPINKKWIKDNLQHIRDVLQCL
ncbi:hypothetical protein BTO32_15555 [Marinobacter lutaoensis]|uniref:Helix-turn-helix type 11 domain-containing protein n=1 Tax=Marinobacter lutaoensis TaxID=135739 RepID=A0A1V2DQ06_9GAMM|nr:helix-turn-helix domain-containing protein [Marinobacter lutaoensis]ONF42619.1 hypothetical protein BTO32_15555 [Marinobacter lutaoensis]